MKKVNFNIENYRLMVSEDIEAECKTQIFAALGLILVTRKGKTKYGLIEYI